ncbi:MAG TPA: pyridoxal-dependent decarboxylase, exosortase A system-associated, partial [Rhodocyclaceae bacterium]|nr:pyridoxal-dependent decarboxylase, exosortase A system-associated [Rhodocyclaceae bacterium]
MKPLLAHARQRWGLTADTGERSAALQALAARHGTPLYLYSGPLIDQQVAALRAELPATLALLYAVKANPHPDVLARLARQVDGCDVTSSAEMRLAQQAGVAGEALSLAGPGKTNEELATALAANALVVLESLGEARRLAALASHTATRTASRRPRVALRLN